MGTPCIINFIDTDDKTVACVFHQSDGYPAGAGKDLCDWLHGFKIGDGAPREAKMGEYANGMTCMAAQYIAMHKDRVGGLYMLADMDDWYTAFVYDVKRQNDPRMAPILVTVYDSALRRDEDVIAQGSPAQIAPILGRIG